MSSKTYSTCLSEALAGLAEWTVNKSIGNHSSNTTDKVYLIRNNLTAINRELSYAYRPRCSRCYYSIDPMANRQEVTKLLTLLKFLVDVPEIRYEGGTFGLDKDYATLLLGQCVNYFCSNKFGIPSLLDLTQLKGALLDPKSKIGFFGKSHHYETLAKNLYPGAFCISREVSEIMLLHVLLSGKDATRLTSNLTSSEMKDSISRHQGIYPIQLARTREVLGYLNTNTKRSIFISSRIHLLASLSGLFDDPSTIESELFAFDLTNSTRLADNVAECVKITTAGIRRAQFYRDKFYNGTWSNISGLEFLEEV